MAPPPTLLDSGRIGCGGCPKAVCRIPKQRPEAASCNIAPSRGSVCAPSRSPAFRRQRRPKNLNADYFNNLEQYQYKAQQQVQRDYRTVQKQVATAPAAAPLKGSKGKDSGYLWVGGKVGNRAFDDPISCAPTTFGAASPPSRAAAIPTCCPTIVRAAAC